MIIEFTADNLKTAKAESDLPLIFNPIPIDNLRFISFSDSSWANRSDGSSQGGQLHLITDKEMLDGNLINHGIPLFKLERELDA